jgi:hypothetical protein
MLEEIDIFKISNKCNEKTKVNIKYILEFEDEFKNMFISYSNKRLGVASLITNDLSEISEISHGLPREFSIFCIYENLYFSSISQFLQIYYNYSHTLKIGDLYTSIMLLRSMLEITAFSSYPLNNSHDKLRDMIKTLKIASKTKSKIEKDRLGRKYSELIFESYKIAVNSYYSVGEEISGINTEAKNFKFENFDIESKPKKIHISKTIEDLEKRSGIKLSKQYDLLSEFTHPNFASRLFVMEERNNLNPIFEQVNYAIRAKSEALNILYLETFSETVLNIFQLFFGMSSRYGKYLDVWNDLFEYAKNK